MNNQRVAIAIIMAATGLDPKEAAKRLLGALHSIENDSSEEYKAFREELKKDEES